MRVNETIAVDVIESFVIEIEIGTGMMMIVVIDMDVLRHQ